GVPDAVSVMVCTPVVVKFPDPAKLKPATFVEVIDQVPIVVTFTSISTLFAAVSAVPCVNVPDTTEFIHVPGEPFNVNTELPPLLLTATTDTGTKHTVVSKCTVKLSIPELVGVPAPFMRTVTGPVEVVLPVTLNE